MKNNLFASREQQREGLKWILSITSLKTLCRALDVLEYDEYITGAHRNRIIKDARHILGISHKDFIDKRF